MEKSLKNAVPIPYTVSLENDIFKLALEENLNTFSTVDRYNFSSLLTPVETAENERLKSLSTVLLKSRSRNIVQSLFDIKRQPKKVVLKEFKFTDYIKPDSRLVLIGETHYEHLYKKPVMSIVEELKASGRDVFLASEFVAADLPLGKTYYGSNELDAVSTHAYYQGMLQFAQANGVKVIPLESETMMKVRERRSGTFLSDDLEALRKYWETFVMMKKRNVLWAARLKMVLDENPQAVIVVHCGEAHSEYGSVYNPSLPQLLKEYNLTNFVTFGAKYTGIRKRIWHRSEIINDPLWKRLYYVTAMPPELARIMGADVFVHLPEEGTGEYLIMRGQLMQNGFTHDEYDSRWVYLPSKKIPVLTEEEIMRRFHNWDD